MISERVITDATTGAKFAWDGLTRDPLPSGALVLHPQTNATFDDRDERTFGELPTSPLVRVPRTTWFGPRAGREVVGSVIGPDGCRPLSEPLRSSHAFRKNRRAQPDAADDAQPDQHRRNRHARNTARVTLAPKLSDPQHRGGREPE